MAKVITKVSVSAPTNLTATGSAGGNLVNGTTYYYRLISDYRYNDCNVLSLPSAEVSFTADATNKTCTLAWTAATNAEGYIIQRTTTSGSYPFGSLNTFNTYEINYVYAAPIVFPGTSFVDNGATSGSGAHTLTCYNLYHGKECPCIEVSATAGETITLQDIYAADVAGGWGVVDKICNTELKTLTSATYSDEVPYYVFGSLYIHDCTFQQRGVLIHEGGSFITSASTTILKLGGTNHAAYTLYEGPFSLQLSNAAQNDYGGYRPNQLRFYGTSSSSINNFIKRSAYFYGSSNPYPYNNSLWEDGLSISTAPITNSIFGYGTENGYPMIAFGDTTGTIMEGARPSGLFPGTISNTTFRFTRGYPQLWGWSYHYLMNACTFSYGLYIDAFVGGASYIGTFVDCKFLSQGQTDNIPYLGVRSTDNSMIGDGWAHQFNLKLKVVDSSGNPISGATVTVIDANGNNDLWENTGVNLTSHYSNLLNNTDSSNTLYLTNSSFSVGEYIRFEYGSEIFKITSKVSTDRVVVDRGQLGSTKERNIYYTTPTIHRIIASQTTDANGEIITTAPSTGRSLYIAINNGTHFNQGYEDDLVTSGLLTQNSKTPHSITISKAGYQTRTIKYTMDRKREEVETLEAAVPWIMPQGNSLYWNTDKTNSQNKFGYAPI